MASAAPDADSLNENAGEQKTTGSDSVERFASDLRALRLTAGSPTLFSLQHATSISKTVLSDAFRGQRLPSERTVDRLVRAMQSDPASWILRRDRLAQATGATDRSAESAVSGIATPEPSAADLDAPATGSGARRGDVTIRRRTAILLSVAALIVGVLISGGVSYAVATPLMAQARADAIAQTKKDILNSPQSEHAQINVRTGVDPALSPCVNDAKVVTSDMRTNNTKLEIIWSNKCYAGWARVTRYDEKVSGNTLTVAIYPETAPNGPDRQSATEPNVQSAYTTLVVRPSPQTRLCAVASITVNGASIDLGEPLCT